MDISARLNKRKILDAGKAGHDANKVSFLQEKALREVERILGSDVGNLSSSCKSVHVTFCVKPCGTAEEAKNLEVGN